MTKSEVRPGELALRENQGKGDGAAAAVLGGFFWEDDGYVLVSILTFSLSLFLSYSVALHNETEQKLDVGNQKIEKIKQK